MEDIKVETTRLLHEFYQIYSDALPTLRIKSEWRAENKHGFFLGIIQAGEEEHVRQLRDLLSDPVQFQAQQTLSTHIQFAHLDHLPTFIDEMFAFYIQPFHSDYSLELDHCVTHRFAKFRHASSTSSKRSWIGDTGTEFYSADKLQGLMTHYEFKQALINRDKMCMTCWEQYSVKAAQIIGQGMIPRSRDEHFTLRRAGLEQRHQVQNGLLLCPNCIAGFHKLQFYVDRVDDVLVFRGLHTLNNDTSTQDYKEHKRRFKYYSYIRKAMVKYMNDPGREMVTKIKDELVLHFRQKDAHLHPNQNALRFHKTACIIWRLAGGVEMEEMECRCCFLDYEEVYPSQLSDQENKAIEEWVEMAIKHAGAWTLESAFFDDKVMEENEEEKKCCT